MVIFNTLKYYYKILYAKVRGGRQCLQSSLKQICLNNRKMF